MREDGLIGLIETGPPPQGKAKAYPISSRQYLCVGRTMQTESRLITGAKMRGTFRAHVTPRGLRRVPCLLTPHAKNGRVCQCLNRDASVRAQPVETGGCRGPGLAVDTRDDPQPQAPAAALEPWHRRRFNRAKQSPSGPPTK